MNNRRSTEEQISFGIDRIIIGYARKVIIADTLGTQIQLINLGIATGGVDTATIWLRTLLYFFQIYFDFSGYSDVAIGMSNIFGFSIQDNFQKPYLSKSVTEFWRRWHISLGTWFKEYVYIPLGGNRRGNTYFHLIIVFLLTGIWHGAGWTFLIWGMVHGLSVVIERAIHDHTWYQRTPNAIKWLFTLAVVFFSWVLFMSGDIFEAGKIYSALFTITDLATVNFTWQYYLSGSVLLLLCICIAEMISGINSISNKIRSAFAKKRMLVKRVLLLFLFGIDILYLVNSTYSPFIYFQF